MKEEVTVVGILKESDTYGKITLKEIKKIINDAL